MAPLLDAAAARPVRSRIWATMPVRAVALAAFLSSGAVANAQEPPPVATVKFVGGYAGFLDEATIGTAVAGVAYSRTVAERLAIGPEFLYLRRSALERSFVLQVNIVRPLGLDRRLRP